MSKSSPFPYYMTIVDATGGQRLLIPQEHGWRRTRKHKAARVAVELWAKDNARLATVVSSIELTQDADIDPRRYIVGRWCGKNRTSTIFNGGRNGRTVSQWWDDVLDTGRSVEATKAAQEVS